MASSYLTLEPGTPVTDRFGQPVGEVKRVLIAEAQHFDATLRELDVLLAGLD